MLLILAKNLTFLIIVNYQTKYIVNWIRWFRRQQMLTKIYALFSYTVNSKRKALELLQKLIIHA